MCGRYTLDLNAKRLAEQYGLDDVLDDLTPRYNIKPGQLVPVVGMKPGGGKRGLAKLLWGLVPRWANDPRRGMKPINARAETIQDKPYFRESFETRRCVIPASGFYEWMKVGRGKQPQLIRLADERPMSFAGIWDVWGQGPNRVATCCIITVAANELLKPIHDRMPAILPDEAIVSWLEPDTPIDTLQAWLKPYPDHGMSIVPVGTLPEE